MYQSANKSQYPNIWAFTIDFQKKRNIFWIESADFDTKYFIVYQALQILAKFLLTLLILIRSVTAFSYSSTGTFTL